MVDIKKYSVEDEGHVGDFYALLTTDFFGSDSEKREVAERWVNSNRAKILSDAKEGILEAKYLEEDLKKHGL